jgi:hypothetical protein
MSQPTDLNLGGEIQDHFLEPYDGGLTWPTGLWTFAQVYAALTDAQNELLRDTGCLLTSDTIPILGHTHRGTLPQDFIAMADVVWRDAGGRVTEIPRSDDVEADNAQADWEVNAVPIPLMYTDATQPQLQMQVMPAPNAAGQAEILYVALGATLTGAGVPLTVPELITQVVKWRAVGILLETLGRAGDFEAASYCRQRYQEGVAALEALLTGWTA